MLLALLAAAAVQVPPAAPISPSVTAPNARQLSCPSPLGLQARTVAAKARNAVHTLEQEPDAAMIRPVARNYCEARDVVRVGVSGDTARRGQEPATGTSVAPRR